jgi:hypothetical protein
MVAPGRDPATSLTRFERLLAERIGIRTPALEAGARVRSASNENG